MSGICEGRVCVITGAGRGIGREYALMLAEQGAKIVVNDLGGDMTGEGEDASPAQQVVAEIEAMGGEAVANGANVADFDAAGAMIQQAVDHFGRLDVLVNNAGILRDRMLVNMAEGEWDAVIAVHLKGTFGPTRHAAAHWRERVKAGETVDARIINTTSPSGIYGNVGQTNYGAAKAGIAAFTVISAMELERYGVTCNAIAPGGHHPHDRGPRHGPARRGDQGVDGAALDRPDRHLAGQPGVQRRSPAGSSRCRAASWPSPRAGTGPGRDADRRPHRDRRQLVAELMANARPNADMSGNDKK